MLLSSYNDYMTCHQGEFETITSFKERFDNKLKAYNNALGPRNVIPEPRAAMAFLSKLHKLQYGRFYAHEINIINADATKVPKTVVEIYQKAKAHVIIAQTTKQNGTPVSFATTAESYLKSNKKKTPRGGNRNQNNTIKPTTGSDGRTSTTTPSVSTPAANVATTPTDNNPSGQSSNRNTPDISRVQCYNCQLFGHYARDCPSKEDDPLNAMTTGPRNYYQPKWYEVGLDTLSQVNILNSRFLEDFVPADSSFKGFGNQSRSTSYVGTLPVLPKLKCLVCDDCAASVLSFALIKKTGVDISYLKERGFVL